MRALACFAAAVALAITGLAPAARAQHVDNPTPAGALPAQASNGSANAGALGEFASIRMRGTSPCAGAASYTSASPAVVTCASNTFAADCTANTGIKCIYPIYFTGFVGGNGISNSTLYYVGSDTVSGSAFKLATTAANANNGIYVNTTGSEGAVGTAIEGALVATSNTEFAVGALGLSPGDWDCSGVIVTTGVASTAPTNLQANINQGNSTNGSTMQSQLAFTTGAVANNIPVLPMRLSLAAQTAITIRFTETWTGGATNPVASGGMRCRRAG